MSQLQIQYPILNPVEDILTDFLDKYIEQNVEYFNTLTKIKMLVEQIQVESGELHVLELAIRIKKLIQEVI